MKKSNYTEEQIAFALKQAELGAPISEVCRKLGISEQTFYRWKSKYGGMLPSDMKRLRQLEEENAKLKKLVADLSLDKLMLQDVLTKKFKACREAASGAVSAGTLSSERTQKLYGIADQPGMASEAANPRRAGLFTNENQGNRLCEEAIWIPKDPCLVAA